MKSIRLLDRRAGYSLSAIGLLLGMVAPAVLPAFAEAGTLNTRSIAMSSSAAGATGVSYDLLFTAETGVAANGGLVIDFCNGSPLAGSTCTTTNVPDASNVSLTDVTYDAVAPGSGDGSVADTNSGHTITWTAATAYTAGQDIRITLGNIVNPASAGTFYARVYTYANATNLAGYTDFDTLGTTADTGSVALSATNAVGVTAYVMESMTFCVSHSAPTQGCAGTDSPSLTLGEAVGTVKALSTSTISADTDYAQLSTNASGGAVVNLKSNATLCGGLFRNNDTTKCDIAPMATPNNGATGFSAGSAFFGLTVGAATSATGAGTPSGDLVAANGYDDTHYFIDYDGDDDSGVTSTYGSALFDTGGEPVNHKNIPITFGASISNDTPAGVYGATLNMIATGTF